MRVNNSALLSLLASSSTCGRKSPFSSTTAFSVIASPTLHYHRAFAAASSTLQTCPTSEDWKRKRHSKVSESFLIGNTLPVSTRMFSTRGGATEQVVSKETDDAPATTSTPTTASTSEMIQSASSSTPKVFYRNDYTPLPYKVTKVSMNLQIFPNQTTVTSHLTIIPSSSSSGNENWVLDGDATSLKLISIELSGKMLFPNIDYSVTEHELILFPHSRENSKIDGSPLELKTIVEICPETNTQLSGLYKSGSLYCSQCEAMGFRRITYYPDRPDNMAIFDSVRIEAEKDMYPVLLSNGDLVESGPSDDLSSTRHYAIWKDPYPKPSYLFCIVAGGQLGSIKDEYITKFSKRRVHLEIFSEQANVHKLDFAMRALKNSMKWDEDTFGLEYDLDTYNIVAVNDFNMGAMENKGLNVFNTAYVLSDPQTATDVDYERIEAVIGHEYFHNWTGNRVTVINWFQLTLKEGLTVFRDQQFSADMMGSFAVKRIEDVRALRARQFSEDAGPMSHPIRPESYISMDNFYTSTVYSKGAEIIRMYHTLLTADGFRRGMDLYFKRHDGSAVSCDDFRAAMADANDVNLDQFGLWYSTAGTPMVSWNGVYDKETEVYYLTLSQTSKSDDPLHIPVSVGLLDKATSVELVSTTVLELKQNSQTFEFKGIKGEVVPSILRDFSAPVKLAHVSGEENEEDLAFLAAFDTNGFNKWEAGQKLFTNCIFQVMNASHTKQATSNTTRERALEAFGRTLRNKDTLDFSIKAYALSLPAESSLSELLDSNLVVDPVAIHTAREKVKMDFARTFEKDIRHLYDDMSVVMESEKELVINAESIGRRRLRNVLLEYLSSIRLNSEEESTAADLALKHFQKAKGMTDKYAALIVLCSMKGKGATVRDSALTAFYKDANGDALVLNKWFTAQALADLPNVLDRVKTLTEHPDFIISNPNRFRSLVSAFTMNNAHFHASDGSGYRFIADMIIQIDKLNPQVSSRLATSLINWKKYGDRGCLMKEELQRLASLSLSDDLFEVVTRGLQ